MLRCIGKKSGEFVESVLIIVGQLVVNCKIFTSFFASFSYNNRKMFCKLDVCHKSIVTLALL